MSSVDGSQAEECWRYEMWRMSLDEVDVWFERFWMINLKSWWFFRIGLVNRNLPSFYSIRRCLNWYNTSPCWFKTWTLQSSLITVTKLSQRPRYSNVAHSDGISDRVRDALPKAPKRPVSSLSGASQRGCRVLALKNGLFDPTRGSRAKKSRAYDTY